MLAILGALEQNRSLGRVFLTDWRFRSSFCFDEEQKAIREAAAKNRIVMLERIHGG